MGVESYISSVGVRGALLTADGNTRMSVRLPGEVKRDCGTGRGERDGGLTGSGPRQRFVSCDR